MRIQGGLQTILAELTLLLQTRSAQKLRFTHSRFSLQPDQSKAVFAKELIINIPDKFSGKYRSGEIMNVAVGDSNNQCNLRQPYLLVGQE